MAANGNDIEKRLWEAADQLRANSSLMPSEYSGPVLGLLFLRYAEKKFAAIEAQIGPVGSGTWRKIGKADYQAEGVIFLTDIARFSYLQDLTEGDNIGNLRTQRDLLLPKLISGEIDVSEAAKNIEEVA